MDGTSVLSGPNPVVGMRGDRRVPFVRSGIFITFVTRMMEAFRRRYASLGADSLVALWLGIWWVCNVAQAGLAQLANDEAYYHLFAERLAWGYFDHPPVTALLVWLGERLFGGELGVRFFFTVLQPLYLWILCTYSPRHADPRLLATPTSCGRVAAHNPNWDCLFEIRFSLRCRFPLLQPL